MSTVDISPPLPSQSPHNRLFLDEVELTGFRPGPASRRPSRTRTSIIDVDDGDGQGARLPSMNPQATPHGVRDDQIIIIEEPGIQGSQSNRGSSHGAQNRPIIVLDSDEEQGPVPLSGFGSRSRVARRRSSRTSSFRIFSPSPPPPQHHPIPPVPPLPPIIAEPLPFTILFPPTTDSNNNPTQTHLPFDESSQASNVGGGGIQLGGGLFSQGSGPGRRRGVRTQVRFQPRRADDHESSNEASNVPPRNSRGASSFFGRIFASYVSANRFMSDTSGPSSSANSSSGQPWRSTESISSRPLRHLYNDISLLDFGREHGAPGTGFFGLATFGQGPWARRDATVGLGPDYDKSMTHPERVGPGWTYDFGTEQEPESGSKMDGSEILVCAKCLDPLLANAQGMTDVSEAEKNGRRVWGLRCGHVLDGKCVGILMRPELEQKFVKDVVSDGKEVGMGNGKLKQVDLARAGQNEADELVTKHDIKGKGKILRPEAPTPPFNPAESVPLSLSPAEPNALGLSTEDNSIRSRLRSRRTAAMASTTPHDSPIRHRRSARHPTTSDHLNPVVGASTRRRGTKRKRATNAKERVEARYEWTCPVTGCGCTHVSIKVGGVWKMDPQQGAVGMYV